MRNDIEYFLICADDPTIPLAIDLAKRDCDQVCVVSGHNAAYSAFNEMIDRSSTKYAFQVDGDQLLYEGHGARVEKCAQFMDNNPDVAFCCFPSWDSFEEREIWASCKLYNMNIIRKLNVRFKDMPGCDRDMNGQIKRHNFKCLPYAEGRPIAIHALKECGPEYVFSRFQNRVLKDGLHCQEVKNLLPRSIKRFREEGDMMAAAFILGCFTPYRHSGEVKRENQIEYLERQWFVDIEKNKKMIEDKVNKALNDRGL